MSNISNAYMRSTAFLGASLALGLHFAAAEDHLTSQACKQEQLAGEDSDKAETKSEVLAKCDSVIRPPQVGDQEMVEPAPSVGRIQVIKPEQSR